MSISSKKLAAESNWFYKIALYILQNAAVCVNFVAEMKPYICVWCGQLQRRLCDLTTCVVNCMVQQSYMSLLCATNMFILFSIHFFRFFFSIIFLSFYGKKKKTIKHFAGGHFFFSENKQACSGKTTNIHLILCIIISDISQFFFVVKYITIRFNELSVIRINYLLRTDLVMIICIFVVLTKLE